MVFVVEQAIIKIEKAAAFYLSLKASLYTQKIYLIIKTAILNLISLLLATTVIEVLVANFDLRAIKVAVLRFIDCS